MDEFEFDVLDVVRLARPGVEAANDEALARLRATIFGEFSSPGDDNSPMFEPAPGAPGPATRASQVVEDETAGEVLELVAVGGGEGWTGPTADDFATSQYAVTRLVDGTAEVPFDERLRIGLLDPPPGAGVMCRQSELPPGAGSGTIVVKDGRVAQWVPCDLSTRRSPRSSMRCRRTPGGGGARRRAPAAGRRP